MSTKPTRKNTLKRKKHSPSESKAPAVSGGDGQTRLSEQERQRMVAEAAYYRALQRGFTAGGEVDDWLAAEREIDQRLSMAGAIPASRTLMGAPPVRSESKHANTKAPQPQ